jgi:hypothetical protein
MRLNFLLILKVVNQLLDYESFRVNEEEKDNSDGSLPWHPLNKKPMLLQSKAWVEVLREISLQGSYLDEKVIDDITEFSDFLINELWCHALQKQDAHGINPKILLANLKQQWKEKVNCLFTPHHFL